MTNLWLAGGGGDGLHLLFLYYNFQLDFSKAIYSLVRSVLAKYRTSLFGTDFNSTFV